MALIHSPKLNRDGLVIHFDAANQKSYKPYSSLINTNNWALSEGGTTGYNPNQTESGENQRVMDAGPWGVPVTVWETRPSGVGGGNSADGGWNTDWVSIDKTKLYRFSMWMRRTTSSYGGTFYFGLYSSPSSIILTANNASEGNPYWQCIGAGGYTQNVWYLIIGHCYPYTESGSIVHPDTGLYLVNDPVKTATLGFCNVGADVRWPSDATSALHRAYHYYCGDATTRLQFYDPRLEAVDGTEPSISDLVYGVPNMIRNINKGEPKILNVFPTPTDVYAWCGVAGAERATLVRDTITSPVGNTPLKMSVTGADPYTDTYSSVGWNLAPAVRGQTWTISAWIKASAATSQGAGFYVFGANSSGVYGELSNTMFDITTSWTKYSMVYKMTNEATTAIQLRLDGVDSGAAIDIWYDGIHIQQNPIGSLSKGVTFNESNKGAVVLDGVSDCVDLGMSANTLGITNQATFTGWIKPISAGAWMISDWNTTGIDIYTDGSIVKFSVDPGAHYLDHTYTLTNGVWYHLTGVMDGTNMFIYVNGVYGASAVMSGSVGSSSSTLKIGCRGDRAYFGNTEVAIVQVYNRALSASEVYELFNAQRSRFGV